MVWVLGPGTHVEIEKRIHDNPNFESSIIEWANGSWKDRCGNVHRYVGRVYDGVMFRGYIVSHWTTGGIAPPHQSVEMFSFTPPEGDLPCSAFGPYRKTTENNKGTLVEWGMVLPTIPILVIILLMFLAYRYGKKRGKESG